MNKLMAGIAILVSFLVGVFVGVNTQEPTTSKSKGDAIVVNDINESELYKLVNSERTKVGIPQLSLNPLLEASSKEKCDDMVSKDYWAHTSPDGKKGADFIAEHYKSYKFVDENLARDYSTANDAVVGWMNSESHRGAILDKDFTDVGYAVCKEGSGQYVVQHFGSK